MSTGTINSVNMADIGTINGQTVPSGGSGGFQVDSTGLLVYGLVAGPTQPLSPTFFESGISPAQSFSIFNPPTGTTIVSQDYSTNIAIILLDNGDLYSTGYTNSYLGRAITTSTPKEEFHICLQNVSVACCHYAGINAIKNDGTYWITGNFSNLHPGFTTTYSYYSFIQYGTDTDWIDVKSYANYPYVNLYVKGSPGAEYLYASGLNPYGMTGQGTTSGSTAVTRVLSGPGTNLNETFSKIDSVGSNMYAVVSTSGKLFTGGQNNYGRTAQSTSSGNTLYATQVGTDTDWLLWKAGAMGSWGIKTNGTLYFAGQFSTYYGFIKGDTSVQGMYPIQVGTDSNYEDIYLYNYNTSYPGTWEGIIVKKGGEWYYNGKSQSWNDPKSELSTHGQYTWYDFKSSADTATPIGSSRTINNVAILFNNQNLQQEMGIILSVS